MNHDIKTVREAATLVRRTWRGAASFFLSLELWLVVLAAGATVGGMFLAVVGDARCLLAFGFAFGYLALRVNLHLRRVLAWPFL